jgi:hypothetical protein
MPRPLSQLAQEALDVQDASNLSGVVQTFVKALEDLWEHAKAEERGTDWVNQHPVTKAYVSKLISLCGWAVGDGTFREVIALAGGN